MAYCWTEACGEKLNFWVGAFYGGCDHSMYMRVTCINCNIRVSYFAIDDRHRGLNASEVMHKFKPTIEYYRENIFEVWKYVNLCPKCAIDE
jgi:hypothetical protein